MRYSVVIPAAGAISEEYAQRIGTPYRALAPMGLERTPVLQHVVNTLHDSGCVENIICAAPSAVQENITGIDKWLPSAESGAENVYQGLSILEDPGLPALVCTADLPLLTSASIEYFASNTKDDRDISVGVVTRAAYQAAFPEAPMSVFVPLRGGVFITMSCLFRVRPACVIRNKILLEQAFKGRKSQWQMASLLGPRLLALFALRQLSVSSIQSRAEVLLRSRAEALLDCPPDLAFDIDTADDYSYASSRLHQAAYQKTIA